MSDGIAVRSKDQAGGRQLAGGQEFVRVDGEAVVLLGDPVEGHGDTPHDAPVMVEAVGWVRIAGIPVCREGNRASCGHPTTGRGWFRVVG
jgi:uncharacterized Zn-binding protein involved in type VI secretion